MNFIKANDKIDIQQHCTAIAHRNSGIVHHYIVHHAYITETYV